MIKANRVVIIITSCIILLPMIAGLFLWDSLPEVLATHWGLENRPNGFNSKEFTVLGIPLILLVLQWLGVLVTNFDKKSKSSNPKVLRLMFWIIPVCSVLSGGVVYSYGLGYSVDVGFWCTLLIGLMFLIVGNYLPKCQQSYIIGIKLPWTIKDQENWNKTHRVGGFVWTICGAVTIVLSLLRLYIWIIGILVAAVIIPTIYSYILSNKK